MTDLFTPAERLTLARIELRVSRYHLMLMRAAAKAKRIPSARTLITRSMARSFEKVFADPVLPPAPAPATVRPSGHDAANRK
jgi:hypothetical protein